MLTAPGQTAHSETTYYDFKGQLTHSRSDGGDIATTWQQMLDARRRTRASKELDRTHQDSRRALEGTKLN
jgi:hypothetical protein